MKFLNGLLIGSTIASIVFDWPGMGQIMVLCVSCYAFGYAVAKQFWLPTDEMKGTSQKSNEN